MKQMCEQCEWWLENGDGSQRLCVICNPEYDGVLVSTRMEYVAGPSSLKTVESIAFPADEEVQFPDDNETGGKDEDSIFHKAIPWRDVPVNKVWLRLTEIFNVSTTHGPEMIVLLQKRDNEIIKAWATLIIATALKKKEKLKSNNNLFIKSLGKMKCKTNNNYFFNYEMNLYRFSIYIYI